MAVITAIEDHGQVPSTAFSVADETDMLMERVGYRFNRRFQQWTKDGKIKAVRMDQPSAEITLSGQITGTGTTVDSAVLFSHGKAITTDYANWTGSSAIHGFTPTDGVNVFSDPERDVEEDNAELTWRIINYPHMT